ncbi:hypothetical protein GCM10010298_38860 [Streptomyces microflavus]|uniref:Uncharacterized protein n=1 Tax=Streptomyces microflavus TaxID=1919 RepID=A0A7J0D097_STRMI|nr:hypothetical protein Smic_66540 [Streptomyces microflavus]GGX70405.1 hypothetical protein GCM10010298_38860 [Streptomyces microflavus]
MKGMEKIGVARGERANDQIGHESVLRGRDTALPVERLTSGFPGRQTESDTARWTGRERGGEKLRMPVMPVVFSRTVSPPSRTSTAWADVGADRSRGPDTVSTD